MTVFRWLCLVTVLALPASAGAAEVVYPTGSRVGLVPPPGMSMTSSSFIGFEDRDHDAAIVTMALPPEAYGQIEGAATDEALKAQGLTVERRDTVTLAAGKATLITGQQKIGLVDVRRWMLVGSMPTMTVLINVQIPNAARELYPDTAIRAAMDSISLRETVPVEEQLSLLPFKIGDLAGFHINAVSPGRAVVLGDGDQSGAGGETRMIITIGPGAPAQASDREEFAREAFEAIPGIVNIRVTSSEPLRIGGQVGHQVLANGTERGSGKEITVVQWLRFGSNAFMQIVGAARVDAWTQAYARFRNVRDSIETH